jgi:DNA polymerase-3 subunit delta
VSWTPQNLHDSVRRQELYPLYYFYGDETFLIDEALCEIEKLALGDGLRDFNLNTYYGGDADPLQIRDAIETLPMMAQARIVIVKEAHELNDKDWEALLPVIENPVDSSAFVCVASKIDKRKKSIKRFLEQGVVVEFKRPFDNQIPEWIQHIAKKHGLKLDAEAVSVMHQMVGGNLTDIHLEMQKLKAYIGDRKSAEVDDILKVVSRVRIDSVFDLTEAIGGNKQAGALVCLANLLEHGQNEVGVLALISRHVRILKLVNDGLKEGLSGGRLSARAGVSQFFLKQYIEQSRYWSPPKIDRTFRALLETDRALKSSPVAAHLWLENFIIKTCSV